MKLYYITFDPCGMYTRRGQIISPCDSNFWTTDIVDLSLASARTDVLILYGLAPGNLRKTEPCDQMEANKSRVNGNEK